MNIRKKLLSVVTMALIGVTPFVANKVHASEEEAVTKKTMHNSVVYNKDGKNTGTVFASYQDVEFDSKPVKINGKLYYKITDKNQYIKLNNIDGVRRTVKSNAYVYATSTKRANKKVVKKGQTIITYGGSYKFRNGKRYYRVGGPKKQYVKASNLSKSTKKVSISIKEKEATATVRSSLAAIYTKDSKNINWYKVVKKNLKVGTKFIVDRYSNPAFGSLFPSSENGYAEFYRIKGTNNWLYYADVKVNKQLPFYDYDSEHYSYIRFIKNTNVYNADGTMQNHNGEEIRKQGGNIKVDKLMYLWFPSLDKAELVYPMSGRLYSTSGGMIDVGKNAYVKASDVKFISGIKLAPSNTPQEAKAAYEVSQSK